MTIHPLRTPRSSHLSQGDSQLLLANAITHFLPLRQGRVPRRGEGVDKPSAPSCRNEVYDPSSASVKHERE